MRTSSRAGSLCSKFQGGRAWASVPLSPTVPYTGADASSLLLPAANLQRPWARAPTPFTLPLVFLQGGTVDPWPRCVFYGPGAPRGRSPKGAYMVALHPASPMSRGCSSGPTPFGFSGTSRADLHPFCSLSGPVPLPAAREVASHNGEGGPAGHHCTDCLYDCFFSCAMPCTEGRGLPSAPWPRASAGAQGVHQFG